MEDSTTDTEKEEEEEKGEKDQKDPIYAVATTINIQDERFIDLATTPAFICLHEVHFSLYSKTWIIMYLKIQMKLISLSDNSLHVTCRQHVQFEALYDKIVATFSCESLLCNPVLMRQSWYFYSVINICIHAVSLAHSISWSMKWKRFSSLLNILHLLP